MTSKFYVFFISPRTVDGAEQCRLHIETLVLQTQASPWVALHGLFHRILDWILSIFEGRVVTVCQNYFIHIINWFLACGHSTYNDNIFIFSFQLSSMICHHKKADTFPLQTISGDSFRGERKHLFIFCKSQALTAAMTQAEKNLLIPTAICSVYSERQSRKFYSHFGP